MSGRSITLEAIHKSTIARNTRQRYGLAGAASIPPYHCEVEVRDLTLYEQLATTATAEVTP